MSVSSSRYLVPAACALIAGALLFPSGPAEALPVAPKPALDNQVLEAQSRARKAPRGKGVRTRSVVRPVARPVVRPVARPVARPGVRVVRPAVRPGVVRRGSTVIVRPARPARYYGTWYRPYRWNPGGAIAAGAAIGFLGAAAAAAYYSAPPPAPGLCWYYTNPSRTAGFWDVCP